MPEDEVVQDESVMGATDEEVVAQEEEPVEGDRKSVV